MTEKPTYEAIEKTVSKHKKVDEALWERKEQNKTLFENNHSVMLLIDPENGDIVDANSAAISYYGWRHEEITGKKITDINVFTNEKVFQEMERAKKENRKQFFFRHRLSNKEIRDVEVYSGPIAVNGKKLLFSIVHDITEKKQAEEALQQRTRELDERVKELNCLYGIAHLVEKSGNSLQDIMQGTVELIPPSWQYPEITCARITFRDHEFKTGNFVGSAWKQMNDIIVHGEPVGNLEVHYLEERPACDEGPFLKEERNLIDGITERLGRIIERKQAETERDSLIKKLQKSLSEVKTLSGLLPICSHCKKIRDDKGYWNQIEGYLQTHSEAKFSHGMCPECSDELYGNEDWYIEMKNKEKKKEKW